MPLTNDITLIDAIAARAVALARQHGVNYPMLDAILDVQTAHRTKPLRLAELLGADDGNFAHDVFGINKHLNRETGLLEDCFVPRYARR